MNQKESLLPHQELFESEEIGVEEHFLEKGLPEEKPVPVRGRLQVSF